jgi:hypothetical protein
MTSRQSIFTPSGLLAKMVKTQVSTRKFSVLKAGFKGISLLYHFCQNHELWHPLNPILESFDKDQMSLLCTLFSAFTLTNSSKICLIGKSRGSKIDLGISINLNLLPFLNSKQQTVKLK